MPEPGGPTSPDRDHQAVHWTAAWEELRPILDAIGDHVWVATARADRVLYSNRAYEDIFGLPVDELLADPQSFLRLLDPGDRERVKPKSWVSTSTSDERDFRITRDDGSRRTIRVRSFPVVDQDGSILAVAGVTEDVSEEAQLRVDLESTQARLVGIIESTSDAIVAIDRNWCFRYTNRIAGVLLTREPSALIGQSLWTEFPEMAGEQIADALRQAMIHGVAETFETYFAPWDRWFMVRVFPNDEGLVIVFHETTESRRDEAARRSYLHMLERANVIVVGADDGIIRFWNQGATDLYGYAAEVAIGQQIRALLKTSSAESFETRLATLLRDGIWQGQLVHTTSDGRTITVASHWVLHEDPEGGADVIVEVNNDITELLAAQNESVELRNELHRAERLDALGRITGGVAHDFNNLLSVILNNLDFAMEQADADSGLAADIQSAKRAAERAVALTQQLLIFARSGDAEPSNIDVDDIVTDLASMLSRALGSHIELQLELGHTGVTVHADPTRVEQILLNLAGNAGDAMPRGGTLTIATSVVEVGHEHSDLAAGRYLALVVSDSGTGMSEHVIEHAFEPFFTTKQVGHGTGLGLSTVFGAAVQAGGTATIRSTPGQGTTVSVWLPCSGTDDVRNGDDATTPPLATVLLIESDSDVRRAIKRILRTAQYRVVDVADTSSARRAWASQPAQIHAIIAHMGISGTPIDELISEFRNESPGLPVVLVSGNPRADRADRAELAAPVHFVAKPFTSEQLIEALHQILGQPQDHEGEYPTR